MNVVNKILLDLTCQDHRQAKQLIANWTPHLADLLGEALTDLCTRLDDPAKTIVIDRLELNIGNLNESGFSGKLQQLKTELLKSLSGQFAAGTSAGVVAVSRHIPHSNHSTVSQTAISEHTLPAGDRRPSFSHLKDRIPAKMRSMDTADRAAETFYYFLQEGNLPWWQKPAYFSFDLVLQNLLSRQPDALLQMLTVSAANHSVLSGRIIRHASPDTLSILFKLLSISEKDLQLMARLRFPDLQEPVVYKKGAQPLLSDILALALDFHTNNHIGPAAAFVVDRLKTPTPPPAARPIYVSNDTDIPNSAPSDERTKPDAPETIRQDLQLVANTDIQVKETSDILKIGPQKPAEAGVKYATEQAGLVLLAGYLPHFLLQLGMRNEREFLSDQEQIRAIHALHYLAVNRNEPPEYALALEKLLCGFHPATPLAFEPITDPDALEYEANELLDTFISHWSILKNTSRETVRNTFLLRNGILECLSEHEWVLHVENGSFDILLNALPVGSGASTIAFSWSKFILYVNWERP